MEKLFEQIIEKIKDNKILNSYFANYFYIKKPKDPPYPFVFLEIQNIMSVKKIFFTKNNQLEIDCLLKIFSEDYDFDSLNLIYKELIIIFRNFILIQGSIQINIQCNEISINHENFEKYKKDENYKITLSLKIWYFESFCNNFN